MDHNWCIITKPLYYVIKCFPIFYLSHIITDTLNHSAFLIQLFTFFSSSLLWKDSDIKHNNPDTTNNKGTIISFVKMYNNTPAIISKMNAILNSFFVIQYPFFHIPNKFLMFLVKIFQNFF